MKSEKQPDKSIEEIIRITRIIQTKTEEKTTETSSAQLEFLTKLYASMTQYFDEDEFFKVASEEGIDASVQYIMGNITAKIESKSEEKVSTEEETVEEQTTTVYAYELLKPYLSRKKQKEYEILQREKGECVAGIFALETITKVLKRTTGQASKYRKLSKEHNLAAFLSQKEKLEKELNQVKLEYAREITKNREAEKRLKKTLQELEETKTLKEEKEKYAKNCQTEYRRIRKELDEIVFLYNSKQKADDTTQIKLQKLRKEKTRLELKLSTTKIRNSTLLRELESLPAKVRLAQKKYQRRLDEKEALNEKLESQQKNLEEKIGTLNEQIQNIEGICAGIQYEKEGLSLQEKVMYVIEQYKEAQEKIRELKEKNEETGAEKQKSEKRRARTENARKLIQEEFDKNKKKYLIMKKERNDALQQLAEMKEKLEETTQKYVQIEKERASYLRKLTQLEKEVYTAFHAFEDQIKHYKQE